MSSPYLYPKDSQGGVIFKQLAWDASFPTEERFNLQGVEQQKNPKDVPSLKLTAKAPKNGWLEYSFPIGFRPIFRCELVVLGRVSHLKLLEPHFVYAENYRAASNPQRKKSTKKTVPTTYPIVPWRHLRTLTWHIKIDP